MAGGGAAATDVVVGQLFSGPGGAAVERKNRYVTLLLRSWYCIAFHRKRWVKVGAVLVCEGCILEYPLFPDSCERRSL